MTIYCVSRMKNYPDDGEARDYFSTFEKAVAFLRSLNYYPDDSRELTWSAGSYDMFPTAYIYSVKVN